MEVLGDVQLRTAMSTVGGMDEMVHEFIRIPAGVPTRSIRGMILRKYNAREQMHAEDANGFQIPLAAQIMGGEPSTCAEATRLLASSECGAPRIDLNCGCPAKRVNSGHRSEDARGGASLLRDPNHLYRVAKSMVDAAHEADAMRDDGFRTQVSVKMRTGYEDTSRFDEIVCAARDAGVDMIAVHGRTKRQAYSGESDWAMIRRAVELCKHHETTDGEEICIVGNGDCQSGADALRMKHETGCSGIMIGRGAVKNPWVFWDARAAFIEESADHISFASDASTMYDLARELRTKRSLEAEIRFWTSYFDCHGGVTQHSPPKAHRGLGSRMKMIARYYDVLTQADRDRVLGFSKTCDARLLLHAVLDCISSNYGRTSEAALDRYRLASVSAEEEMTARVAI